MDGQKVVIVGGTSGMGLGAARAAVAAGAEVVIAGRREAAKRDLIEGPVRQVLLDFTDERAVRSMFEDIGKLDHLFVTSTPPARAQSTLDQDVASAQEFMNGKLFGSWACARYAAPNIRAGGSITFLTGCISIRPRAGLAMVTATFAALEALSNALALELGPIRVNTIRPGVIDSAMWSFLDDGAREKMRETVRATMPARTIGTIEDIGAAALFLMTNPYVTGTVLEVAGGEPLIALEL